MSATSLPAMIVNDIDLRTRPSMVAFAFHPMSCGHIWEPHLYETGRAYCARCGSSARWVNDFRASKETAL